VQEITVDGDVVFSAVPTVPQANLFNYDAKALSLSNGASVSSWNDLSTRGANLSIASGSPTFEATGLDGQPCVRYDGSDDRHESSGISVSSPGRGVFYGVFQTFQFGTGSGSARFERSINIENTISDINEIKLESNFGLLTSGNNFTGSSLSTSSRTFKVVFDESNSSIQVDGGTVTNGTLSSANYGDISIGARFQNDFFDDMKLGQFVGYLNPSSQTETDAEAALSAKWGVTF
jgi:hypothetical protein